MGSSKASTTAALSNPYVDEMSKMVSALIDQSEGGSRSASSIGEYGTPSSTDTSERGIASEPDETSLGFPGGPETGEFDVSNPDVDAAQNDSRVSGDRGQYSSLAADEDEDDNLG